MTPQNTALLQLNMAENWNCPKPFGQSLHSEFQQELSNSFEPIPRQRRNIQIQHYSFTHAILLNTQNAGCYMV
jgi:hypothetical protein